MNWKFLICGFVPLRKCNASGFGYQAAGDLLGMVTTGILQRNQTDLNEEMMRKQQQWQEDMYNKYQSPEAMMRQYKNAGLNPYLLGNEGSVGSIPSSSSAPMPNASAPSMGYGSAVAQQEQTNASLEYYSAVAGNQKAQAVHNMFMAVSEAMKHGTKNARMLLDEFAPQLRALDVDDDSFRKMFDSQFAEQDAMTSLRQIELALQKEFGRERSLTEIEQMNQSIAESVGRLGLMSSQADVNRATVGKVEAEARELGARLALDFAQAGYFKALGSQISQLTPYVAFNAMLGSGCLAMDYLTSEADFSQNEKVREWQHTDKAKYSRKITNSMAPSNNVVGAFMDGFLSKVPSPWLKPAEKSWKNVSEEYGIDSESITIPFRP